MDDQDPNPYAAPTSYETAASQPKTAYNNDLATRGSRLAAALIDTVILIVTVIPFMVLTGFFERAMQGQDDIVETTLYNLAGLLSHIIVHGYFMATRGQTLGKMAMGIRMVDFETGELLPFVKLVGLRDVPIALISYIPCIGPIVALIDVLMIFGEERRCLHDLIANTKVVKVY